MQIKFRRASLAGAKRQKQCCRAAHCEHYPRGQVLTADAVITHSTPVNHPAIPYADRLRPLQILARDPAGNQYT
jgi:hypothetical protein